MDMIAFVAEHQLCTGCGTCAGICPTGAIRMYISDFGGLFLPKIDEEKCIKCKICVKCCPGHTVNLERINSEVFGKQPKDGLLGNYLGCYIGHSNDNNIRYNASSGGMVTQLLIFALEKGIIDGALVSRMRKDQPLQPEPFIARTKEEILSASKSKYCPVPSNAALREIMANEGKFAVVGLPCHIHGIRMAEANIKGLKDKIVLHVGLLCSHTTNFMGTEFLLRKFKIDKSEVMHINYRGKGWPGFMSIQLKDGRNFDMPFIRNWNAYWNVFSGFLFTPIRCIMCPDQSNESSDISAGDAWLPELKHNTIGESVIITRTAIAEEILALMKSSRIISIKRIPSDKIKESQAFSLNFKKENLSGRLSILTMFGKKIPNINPKPQSRSIALLGAILPYTSIVISSNKRLRSAICHVPLPVFRLYFGLFKYFSLLSKR
jgi:coenzyme F420 hydrogenase subunit beta